MASEKLRIEDLTTEHVMSVWCSMYEHIIYKHSLAGDWVFLHRNQLLDQDKIKEIVRVTEADFDESFISEALFHTSKVGCMLPRADALYKQLCDLAGYSDRSND